MLLRKCVVVILVLFIHLIAFSGPERARDALAQTQPPTLTISEGEESPQNLLPEVRPVNVEVTDPLIDDAKADMELPAQIQTVSPREFPFVIEGMIGE